MRPSSLKPSTASRMAPVPGPDPNDAHVGIIGSIRFHGGMHAVEVAVKFCRSPVPEFFQRKGVTMPFVFYRGEKVCSAHIAEGFGIIHIQLARRLIRRKKSVHLRLIRHIQDTAVAARPDEPAMFLYTSGSTGVPKGVVLSHQSHIWVVETRLDGQDLSRHRFLVAAPLYHMNALALSKLSCAAHATIVLLPQFPSPRTTSRRSNGYRCTWLTAVPPMIAMMLREHEAMARTDFSSVEFVRMGSAPVSQSLMEALHRALPAAKVTNAYGTTEAGPVVFGAHPRGLPQPAMSVGYPHPKVALRLVDESGHVGDHGALEMKCPAVMLGYHNRPDLPPPITADGFYQTGDVFRRDADGFHYFVGRTDDMFVSGGENIYPGDVERMLERHAAVAQACVVPIEDAIKGQKPVAFIILKPGAAPDARSDQALRTGQCAGLSAPALRLVRGEAAAVHRPTRSTAPHCIKSPRRRRSGSPGATVLSPRCSS